jgi:hypothetical protein
MLFASSSMGMYINRYSASISEVLVCVNVPQNLDRPFLADIGLTFLSRTTAKMAGEHFHRRQHWYCMGPMDLRSLSFLLSFFPFPVYTKNPRRGSTVQQF